MESALICLEQTTMGRQNPQQPKQTVETPVPSLSVWIWFRADGRQTGSDWLFGFDPRSQQRWEPRAPSPSFSMVC